MVNVLSLFPIQVIVKNGHCLDEAFFVPFKLLSVIILQNQRRVQVSKLSRAVIQKYLLFSLDLAQKTI